MRELGLIREGMSKITSRYDGVIKKIHYAAEDMAQVGKVGDMCFLPPLQLGEFSGVGLI